MQQLVTTNLYTSANLHGTGHIQCALEIATTEEINIVYEEVIPFACTLATDVFVNYVIQKLREYGPQFYEKKIICNFIGHVVPLRLHLYV
jgi:pumilio RNA-binding family